MHCGDVCTCVQSIRLGYTPRKFLVHPERKTLIIAEADHGSVPVLEREPLPPAFAGGALGQLSEVPSRVVKSSQAEPKAARRAWRRRGRRTCTSSRAQADCGGADRSSERRSGPMGLLHTHRGPHHAAGGASLFCLPPALQNGPKLLLALCCMHEARCCRLTEDLW